MRYSSLQRLLPRVARDYIFHFEPTIKRAVSEFALALPDGSRVLDAGAGEGKYANFFRRHHYYGVDLCIGDFQWDYSRVEVLANLGELPFPDACFDVCVNIVTLKHVNDPIRLLKELARTPKHGSPLLLVVPQDWEVHQAPHDFFRFTRYSIRHLLDRAGFAEMEIRPGGGLFRLLSRWYLNALQLFPPLLFLPAALFLVPAALVFPLFDFLDHERNVTLGYLCIVRKQS